MKQLRSILSAATILGLALAAPPALGSTGVCDVSPGDNGASEVACVNAIAALGAGTVVDGIFKDSNGKTGDQLIYGQLIDPYGGFASPTAANGCPEANTICNGDLTSSQGQPAVICINSSHDFATTSAYVNALDWKYANPIRMLNAHGMEGAPNVNCPSWGQSVTDGNTEGYNPWEGMVFDLGGPSNKVVLFPVNDHGPQPCESIEYTVYLTDNPLSRDRIDDPTTSGADPQKWNRAKLSQLFLEGWKKVRPNDAPDVNIPNPNDPNAPFTYTIEADSFTSVWSLPCGINFRYVGIIAGNDGKDLPTCNYDSFDAEIDAVAGLTETGAGICPDVDGDKYVDCNCPTAPVVCDCNDANPAVHPGAPEPCDSPDVNCDGLPGGCAVDLVCYQSICVATCSGGENPFCPAGSTCSNTPDGLLCVPTDCTTGGCPEGTVCSNDICVPGCTAVVCPGTQICQDGQCIDACMGVQCPSPQVCQNGKCEPPCNCFAGDVGCVDQPMTVCDSGNTNTCVPPICKNVQCGPAQHCDTTTGLCVGFCNPGVMCPPGEVCVDAVGCVPVCTTKMCDPGFDCNPMTGMCEDTACQTVTCLLPTVCVMGQCVDQGTGGAGGGGGSGGHGGTAGTTTGAGGAGGAVGAKGACGCRVPGDDGPGAALSMLLAIAGLSGLGARRARPRDR